VVVALQVAVASEAAVARVVAVGTVA
jgi:hypothetical protein